LNGCALDRRALRRREPVESSGEQRADRDRQRKLVLASPAGGERQLLEEERIPPGGADDPLSRRGVELGGGILIRDQSRRLLGRERLEQHRAGVQLPARPPLSLVEQLDVPEAEKEERPIAHP